MPKKATPTSTTIMTSVSLDADIATTFFDMCVDANVSRSRVISNLVRAYMLSEGVDVAAERPEPIAKVKARAVMSRYKKIEKKERKNS